MEKSNILIEKLSEIKDKIREESKEKDTLYQC